MANPINTMKTIASIVELVGDLQSMDADKDGNPDLAEFLVLGGKLAGQFADIQETLKEITDLAGDNVEHIKTRLGIE